MKHNYGFFKAFRQGPEAAVLGSFLIPFRHLPLDDARVDPVAPRFDPFLLQFPQQARTPLSKRLPCPARALWQTALQDLKTASEREPIDIDTRLIRSLEHQSAGDEVPQRQGIQLLHHPRRRFATQVRWLGGASRIVMRLLLVDGQFLLPALMVQQDQFPRRYRLTRSQRRRRTPPSPLAPG